ncbi:hypothetical protein [Brasilonema bromeliae]|uniref:NAD/NADP transhydrogenase beta subunit n=1 Tax=Brasilonema bromeliae SPC951 TaxID=385972 RepID=A0ABX1P9X5_9CYAN|nr:hypothetical protein [Brasilonema bromeliae]NMG21141.1 hypothetical protein [Brasilonema bromeliae SPC951]
MWIYNVKIFLAQLQLDTSNVLTNGVVTAQSIAEGWDKQWIDLLQNNTNNNLYGALTNLGIFFAVGTLLFFMAQWIKDVLDNEYSRPLSALIWPFIVVLLLANPGNGTALSNLTLGLRDFLNTINQQVVEAADVNQTYQQALNMSVGEEVVGGLLRPCQSLTGQQQTNCFIKAKEKIDVLLGQYRNTYGIQPWIDRLEIKVNQIVISTGNVSEFGFNSLVGSTTQTIIKNLLVSLQSAFQNLIEVTMLLIAALGPLAVGGSLLPVAGKPIFAWLTGLFSIGIAKISFNIIAVISAAVIVNGPAQNLDADPDLMWFMILLGVLAPIISLGLAAAGGFAVFNAISNTSVWIQQRV